jgi:hypothetical protein
MSPPDTLVQLAKDRDNLWVRVGVASNQSCPKTAYRILMWDRHAHVRNAFVLNPSIPVGVVSRRIFCDPTPSVHAALASRVDLSARSLAWLERYSRRDPAQQYKLVRTRLLQHHSCSPELKARLEKADARLTGMNEAQRRHYQAVLANQTPLLRRLFAQSLGWLVVLIPIYVVVYGVVTALGSGLRPGLLAVLAGSGLLLVEGSVLAIIAKRRGPFLTWRPPFWRRTTMIRLGLTATYLGVIATFVATGASGSVAELSLVVAFVFISLLRRQRRRK